MVFEDEIDHAVNHSRYYVEPQEHKVLPSVLIENVLKSTPKAKLASVKFYNDPGRSVEIGLITPEKKGETKEGKNKHEEHSKKDERNRGEAKGGPGEKMKKGGAKPNLTVFLNPYSGKVIEVFNRRKSFFFQVEMLHRWLLTGNDGVGKKIVGFSTFFFFFILVTGIILWWPKNKKILKQRLKIKSDASWKRLNHDLHIVTGFYTSIFLLVIVITGLVMSFNWINKGIFTLTGSKMESPEPPASVYQADIKPVSIDEVFDKAKAQFSEAELLSIRTPKDSAGVFTLSVLPKGSLESATDSYFVDQYTGKVIGENKASDKNLGQKIRAYIKPIHTGEIYGIPSKILSFIICLLTLTFPVTGIIMWLNRLKGKKKNNQYLIAEEEAVGV